MNIFIRPATVDDASDLAKIYVVTWQQAYRDLLPDELLSALEVREETRKFREGMMQLPADRRVFIAETGTPRKLAAGYCICGPDRDPERASTGEIYSLYVLPEFQGRRIGRMLVHAAARWLAGKGMRRMIIFVLRGNSPSRKFYESMGGSLEREKTIQIRGYPADEVGYGYDLSEAALSTMEGSIKR